MLLFYCLCLSSAVIDISQLPAIISPIPTKLCLFNCLHLLLLHIWIWVPLPFPSPPTLPWGTMPLPSISPFPSPWHRSECLVSVVIWWSHYQGCSWLQVSLWLGSSSLSVTLSLWLPSRKICTLNSPERVIRFPSSSEVSLKLMC